MSETDQPIYERHVFVCTAGEWCPLIDGDGLAVHAALRGEAEAAGLAGRIRVNQSGCFSQCGNGPMVVVYPEGVWYASVSPADAREIVQSHFLRGEPVERLRFRPGTSGAHKLERDADGRPIGRAADWPTPGREAG